jgi:hypothetical protein
MKVSAVTGTKRELLGVSVDALTIHYAATASLAFSGLEAADGQSLSDGVLRAREGIERAPEAGGCSLIDDEAWIVWRKVARREPGKLARYTQAAASRVHPALHVPGLDLFLPAHAIDHEDRPYHLGWLLRAWPPARATASLTNAVAS